MRISLTILSLFIAAYDGLQRVTATDPGPANKDSGVVGEPHGTSFSDSDFVAKGARIQEIMFTGCAPGEHVGQFTVNYKTTIHLPGAIGHEDRHIDTFQKSSHGATGLGTLGLKLNEGEHVTSIDVTTWRAKTGFMHKSHRTRIGSVTLSTNKGQVKKCGESSSPGDPKTTWEFPGYALLYFAGSVGDAIDALSATFIRLDQY